MTAKTLKPRIMFQREKWYCEQPHLNATPIGVGLTPEGAYISWLKQVTPRRNWPYAWHVAEDLC